MTKLLDKFQVYIMVGARKTICSDRVIPPIKGLNRFYVIIQELLIKLRPKGTSYLAKVIPIKLLVI